MIGRAGVIHAVHASRNKRAKKKTSGLEVKVPNTKVT
jgi:hypothetical protein